MKSLSELVFEHKPEETTTHTITTPEEWVAWFGPYFEKPTGRLGYGADLSAFRKYKIHIFKIGSKYEVTLIQTPGMPCGLPERADTLDEAKEKGKRMIRERLSWLLEEDCEWD